MQNGALNFFPEGVLPAAAYSRASISCLHVIGKHTQVENWCILTRTDLIFTQLNHIIGEGYVANSLTAK